MAVSIMDGIKSICMESNTNETFNFPALPYVCQRRFAEICDPRTLKYFASINSTTRNLVKRSHIVKEAHIDYEYPTIYYKISCYCNEGDFCRGANGMDLSSFDSKYEVMDKLAFTNHGEKKTDAHLFQSLPVKLDSIKILGLNVNSMNLTELKTLIRPGVKYLNFIGGIHTDCSLYEFMNFLRSLSKLDECFFTINRPRSSLTFDFYDLVEQCKMNPNLFKFMIYSDIVLGIIKF